MANILVTGGAGFIGSKLIELLVDHNVLVMDKLSPITHTSNSIEKFISRGFQIMVGDICSRADVNAALDLMYPDILIHLAAETGTGRSLYNVELNSSVNVLGLSVVLDVMSERDIQPKQIILASTRAVYGEGPYVKSDSGDIIYPQLRSKSDLESGLFEFSGATPALVEASKHHPKPINIYGSTKLTQENLLQNWCGAFEVPLFVFRLQNVYGAGQSLSNPYTGVLVHFLKVSTEGGQILVYEDGGITRDFIHVSDVVSLLKKAVQVEAPPGVYDVGSGERVDLFRVAEDIAIIAGSPPPVKCPKFRLGDVRHAAAEIERTKNLFGWSPTVSRAVGIREIYEDFQGFRDIVSN